MLHRFLGWTRALLRRRRAEREMQDEMRLHLEQAAERLVARGLSPAAARAQARREFGNVTAIQEQGREARGVRPLEDAARDLRHAVRALGRQPAFSLTAIVTIGLGIGASTAIFSVVHAVLLDPLPYAAPDRLALVYTDMPARNARSFPTAPADFADAREQAGAFEDMAAVFTYRQSLVGDGGAPEQVQVSLATPNLFSMLGIRVALGRDFVPEDALPQPPPPARLPGAAPAPPPVALPIMVILSHEFWRRRYGADSGMPGRTITLGAMSAQVVGILEPGVELLFPPEASTERRPSIWTANRVSYDSTGRTDHFFRVIGRLKPGTTLDRARTDLDRVSAGLRERFPLKQAAGLALRAEPMQDNLVAPVRDGILALMGAVGFVLLIACANVTNLLLVRAGGRERELALRSALGGSRTRLVRELLSESLALALAGGALGLGLARLGIRVLTAIGPATLPRLDAVRMDLVVLCFVAAASLGAALLAGLIPALRASRPDAMELLRPGGRAQGVRGGRWFRHGVVMAEVALSFILLIGSGLMVRSFVALLTTELGFEPERLLTFELQPAGLRQQSARLVYEQRMQESIKGITGVTAVTAASNLPFDGSDSSLRWGTIAALGDPALFRQGQFFFVQKDFFAVMGTRILAGRGFEPADILPPPAPGAPEAPATPRAEPVVVDGLLAGRVVPGRPVHEALGQTLMIRIPTILEPLPYRIVGVVEHQRHTSLSTEERETLYLTGPVAHGKWVVRVSGANDPMLLGPQVRRAVAAVDPLTPVGEVKPMTAFLDRAIAPTRFALVLIGVFAAIAAALAVVGLYSVLANAVRQRTAEIGVRVALGAHRGSILRLVLRQGMRLAGAGIVLGALGALALTRVMGSMLVGVTATDPATFLAVGALFAAIAAIACWIPARQAAGMDPLVALREE